MLAHAPVDTSTAKVIVPPVRLDVLVALVPISVQDHVWMDTLKIQLDYIVHQDVLLVNTSTTELAPTVNHHVPPAQDSASASVVLKTTSYTTALVWLNAPAVPTTTMEFVLLAIRDVPHVHQHQYALLVLQDSSCLNQHVLLHALRDNSNKLITAKPAQLLVFHVLTRIVALNVKVPTFSRLVPAKLNVTTDTTT